MVHDSFCHMISPESLPDSHPDLEARTPPQHRSPPVQEMFTAKQTFPRRLTPSIEEIGDHQKWIDNGDRNPHLLDEFPENHDLNGENLGKSI